MGGGGTEKKATLHRRLLEWPDVITFCKWAPCLLNYTRHLWIAVGSQGRCDKMERWVCRCWRVTLPQASVVLRTDFSEQVAAESCHVHLYTRWIPISQLRAIDFVWICKCIDLQANSVMGRTGTFYQCARRHRGNGFRFHLIALSVRLDQIALQAEIWQCREGNQEMSDCGPLPLFRAFRLLQKM